MTCVDVLNGLVTTWTEKLCTKAFSAFLARNFTAPIGRTKSDDMPADMLNHFSPKRVEELVMFSDVNPTNRH